MIQTAMTMIAACGLVMIASQSAQARPDTRSMTCNQLQSFIQKQGSVVMNTGDRTYGQFVHHRGFCGPSEVLAGLRVPVSGGSCPVKQCKERRNNKN